VLCSIVWGGNEGGKESLPTGSLACKLVVNGSKIDRFLSIMLAAAEVGFEHFYSSVLKMQT